VSVINSRIEGIIIDSVTKQPIAGVTLRIKNATHEVTTTSNGHFTFLTGQKSPYSLAVSFIDYKTNKAVQCQ
jgi:hypothetical protein